jgi:hypothetical protein
MRCYDVSAKDTSMCATLKLAAMAIVALGIVGCSGLNRRRAEKAIDAGEYGVAGRLLQEVLRRNPGDAEAHLLAGKMLLLTDRTEEGDRELAAAAVLAPSLKPRIARIYFDTGVRWVEGRSSAAPPPTPPLPPGSRPAVVRVAPWNFDIEVQADDRLQHYLANAAKLDPQIAPAISDSVLKTAKLQLAQLPQFES